MSGAGIGRRGPSITAISSHESGAAGNPMGPLTLFSDFVGTGYTYYISAN